MAKVPSKRASGNASDDRVVTFKGAFPPGCSIPDGAKIEFIRFVVDDVFVEIRPDGSMWGKQLTPEQMTELIAASSGPAPVEPQIRADGLHVVHGLMSPPSARVSAEQIIALAPRDWAGAGTLTNVATIAARETAVSDHAKAIASRRKPELSELMVLIIDFLSEPANAHLLKPKGKPWIRGARRAFERQHGRIANDNPETVNKYFKRARERISGQ